MPQENKPYIPHDATMPEFTLKAIVLGVLMAMVLGGANAYLGMKAGMTVSATIPAAVIAIAAFRLPFMRGNVLEQNIARTSASVGEALVAGAIFTVPAFVITGVWVSFNYWITTVILLIGGLLGVFFVIMLRRTLCLDPDLPFPESHACAEIVKSGQEGESGAPYVFGSMGLGVLIQILKDEQGFRIFKDCVSGFIHLPQTLVGYTLNKLTIGKVPYQGGIAFSSPAASPALMGVGYIIGPRIATINFTGGVLAWLVFIPLILVVAPDLSHKFAVCGIVLSQQELGATGAIGVVFNQITPPVSPPDLAESIWQTLVRPMAVGAMLVGAVYTLYTMRKSLYSSFVGAWQSRGKSQAQAKPTRLDIDIPFKWLLISSAVLILPMIGVYYYFCRNWGGAVISALLMAVACFVFAAVGGYLVGLVGGSNQPISGLALAVLVLSAVLMLAINIPTAMGVAAVLGVAAVVCCGTSTAGSMIQDLKAGHILGGTPWKMEVAEIISTVVVSFFLVVPIIVLHQAYGIGGKDLPAPQATLMAQLSTGIMSGNAPWGLIMIGVLFAIALILLRAPSPMLIAVGMYLPFETSFAIFAGGVFRYIFEILAERKKLSREAFESADRKGILMASGFIAGEAITGILLAVPVILGMRTLTEIITGKESLSLYENYGGHMSIIIFAVLAFALIRLPLGFGKDKTPNHG